MREASSKKIVIYGVPGSGKTTLAIKLSEALRLPHLEADEVRQIGKQNKSLEIAPFFFLPTTEAYRALGHRTRANVLEGFRRVREAYRVLVRQKINSYRNGCIAEAAFINPATSEKNWLKILVIVPLAARHRKQFLLHRASNALINDQFKNARIIQKFLVDEAKRLNIPIIKNDSDIKSLLKIALSLIHNS